MASTSSIRIPTGLSPEEHQVYQKLIEVIDERKQNHKAPPNIVTITDIAKDVDDLVAMVLLKELHRLGLVVLKGFVANLTPAKQRALLGRGALDSLGLKDIPIAIGTEATTNPRATNPYEFDCDFMPLEAITHLPFGLQLLHKVFKDAKRENEKITLLLISALQDIAEFAESFPNELLNVTEKVVLQGGYSVTDGKLVAAPDAANNSMNQPAADKFHEVMWENSLPSATWTKIATFATPIPDQLFKDIEATGHPIGVYLRKAQVAMDVAFYKTSCDPDPTKRFRPAMDQTWYLKNKSSYFDQPHPEGEPLPVGEEVVKYFNKLVAYDALAALGSGGDDILEHLKISRPSEGFPKPLHQVFGTPGTAGESADPGIDGKAMSVAIQALVKGSLLACQQGIS